VLGIGIHEIYLRGNQTRDRIQGYKDINTSPEYRDTRISTLPRIQFYSSHKYLLEQIRIVQGFPYRIRLQRRLCGFCFGCNYELFLISFNKLFKAKDLI